MTTKLDELDAELDGSWTRPLDASSYSGRRRTSYTYASSSWRLMPVVEIYRICRSIEDRRRK